MIKLLVPFTKPKLFIFVKNEISNLKLHNQFYSLEKKPVGRVKPNPVLPTRFKLVKTTQKNPPKWVLLTFCKDF